jgi:hypothetical protein
VMVAQLARRLRSRARQMHQRALRRRCRATCTACRATASSFRAHGPPSTSAQIDILGRPQPCTNHDSTVLSTTTLLYTGALTRRRGQGWVGCIISCILCCRRLRGVVAAPNGCQPGLVLRLSWLAAAEAFNGSAALTLTRLLCLYQCLV